MAEGSVERVIHYSCTLCCLVISDPKDRSSVTGKSPFDIVRATKGLPWHVDIAKTAHVCRKCLARLKKKINLEQTHNKRVLELRKAYECLATLHAHPILTSTPVQQLATCPINRPSTSRSVSNKTEVKVSVQWPSQTHTRELRDDLESLGKALVRGTFKQIANAAFECQPVKVELVKLVLKEMVKEIIRLCSKNQPSKCRNSTPDVLINLKWANKAPIFYAFLTTASVPHKRKDAATSTCLPSVAIAGAVLLRERCKEINAVQHLISVIIKLSSYQTMFNKFNCMRLVLSNTTMARRLDALGKLQDLKISSWKGIIDARSKAVQLSKAKIEKIEKELLDATATTEAANEQPVDTNPTSETANYLPMDTISTPEADNDLLADANSTPVTVNDLPMDTSHTTPSHKSLNDDLRKELDSLKS